MINFNSPLLPAVERFAATRTRTDLLPLSQIQGKVLFPELKAVMEPVLNLTRRLNPVNIVTEQNSNTIQDEYLAQVKANGYKHTPFMADFRYDDCKEIDVSSLEGVVTSTWQTVTDLATRVSSDRVKTLGCRLALEKLMDDLQTLDLITAIRKHDDQLFKQVMEVKYGCLNTELVNLALQLHQVFHTVGGYDPDLVKSEFVGAADLLDSKSSSADDLKNYFSWALRRIDGLAIKPDDIGYQVEVRDEVQDIDVRDLGPDGHPVVVIPKKYSEPKNYKTVREMLSLGEHEINCHAWQSLTLHRVFGFGGMNYKISSETHYESIAMYADYVFQGFTGKFMKIPEPYYVLGIAQAQKKKGFAEVFQYLFELRLESAKKKGTVSETQLEGIAKQAYKNTRRIFRGVSDVQKNPEGAAFTKDAAYLAGFMEMYQLAELGLGDYEIFANVSAKGLDAIGDIVIDPAFRWPYPRKQLALPYWQEYYAAKAKQIQIEFHPEIPVEKTGWFRRLWRRLSK